MDLQIKRSNVVVITIQVDETTLKPWKLMGVKEIPVTYISTSVLPLQIGDYITIDNENFTINTIPGYQKVCNYEHIYSIIFESDIYKLYDKKFKYEGKGDFPYFGSPLTFANILVTNMNEIDEGWNIGFIDDQDGKNISFENVSCREALTKIAEEFQLEWHFSGTGKTINLVKQVGNVTTHVFEYGRGKGLYSLSYAYQSDKNIVTRAWGYGSTRNLPANYRNGANRLMFDEQYLEMNVTKPDGSKLYGVKEGDFVADDIYPHRDGTITATGAVTPGQLFTISDTSIDFNINDHLLEGVEAKIVFKSGELSGYEFVITRYNHSTKTITFKPLTEQSGYTLPNSTFSPAIGDIYIVTDISLPQSYIDAAEAELKSKTIEYLQENSVPRVLYTLDIDPMHAIANNIILKPGDQVRIKDAQLGLDEMIRVSSVAYPINFPEVLTDQTKITVEIANFVPYTVTERVIADTRDNKKEIKIVDRTSAERARKNAYNLRQLQTLMFDPDGYFNAGNIKPGSIETLMLAVGAKSQNFNLNNVTINPNAAGDENSLIISSGTLIHREISIEGLGYTWEIDFETWADLDPDKYYYVYARCAKTALVGTWQISETPIQTEMEVGYYNFNLGVLYAVNAEGYRDFEFTSGMTYIVGDNITTGRIKSLDGLNYFDLNTAAFNLGDSETGLDWNVTEPGRLTIRGFLIADQIVVGTGAYQNAGLSGASPNGSSSIRFWGGAPAEEKANAPFRVLDNGDVYAKSVLLGYGDGSTGWTVTSSGIISDPSTSGDDNFALIRGSSHDKEFSFGTELVPSSSGGINSLTGRIKNKRVQTDPFFQTTNTALQLDATGANNNIALDILNGDFKTNGEFKVKGNTGRGMDLDIRVRGGSTVALYSGGTEYIASDRWVTFKIVNGINCGATSTGI